MTDLRTAAQQALEAMEGGADSWQLVGPAIDALKAALAEPVQEPGDFDHGIGADRFKVVRGAFWWHVLIGDSPTEHGKFRSRANAEKMAADLLREFRNGAFVQHEAALAYAAPPQRPAEPVAWRLWDEDPQGGGDWRYYDAKDFKNGINPIEYFDGLVSLYTAPPQRKPLTEEEIDSIWDSEKAFADIYAIVRAIERAHGIT